MPDDPLLTVEEVAQQLGVHVETVRRWVRSREIESINLGGPAGYRIRQSALDKFIRDRTNPAKDQ
jgi:excisionase family DNA binding protein